MQTIWRSLVAHLLKEEVSHEGLRPSAFSCHTLTSLLYHSWLAWATSSRAKIQTS